MPTQIPNRIHRRLAPLGLILFLLIPACAGAGDPGAHRATARPRPEAARAQPAAMTDAGWSIVLAAYSGPDAQRQAATAADAIRARVDLPNIRPQPRGRGAAVVAGAYRSPSDPAAQRDLARAREITLDGRTPFATAFLAPPAGDPDPGAIPQYHLSRARIEFGAQSRYTLQIAVYESNNAAEARRAAEQAAAQLRADGEPAFYFHGPSRSMVTLGAFTAAEAGLDTGLPGPILAEYQRRHPYNLVNGRQFLTRSPGQARPAPQPSFLVEIPRE